LHEILLNQFIPKSGIKLMAPSPHRSSGIYNAEPRLVFHTVQNYDEDKLETASRMERGRSQNENNRGGET
jgi:hypothetical protein